MTLSGAETDTIRNALETGNPFPGTTGFAGSVDGKLVRDVLGRYPLFFERGDPTVWSHDLTGLAEPKRVPAGAVVENGEIRQCWELPERSPDPNADYKPVRDAIGRITAQVDPSDLAVAFSGGVDSAILAARFDAPLYTVGFPESHDIQAARSAAALLDRDVHVVELDHEMVERALPAVVEATGRTNAMDVEIALPLFVLAEHVQQDGFDRLALGQGADELFGGYTKVARAPDDPRVEADTIRGARREVIETLPAQLERDVLALGAAGVDPVVPLLHDTIVETALALPSESLVTSRGERKWALRLAARQWLPDRIAFREKKALQYGSLLARELDRIARQNGFKRRLDDHVSKYIEATVSDTPDSEL